MKNTDAPANQLGSNSNQDVFNSIQALDTGITNHEIWISQIHQSLICGNKHSNRDDLCDDAHFHCKFGRWLYSPETTIFNQLDTFNSVVEKHKQMHVLAHKILTKSENSEKISEDEYNAFTSKAIAFKLDVRNLQYELMSQVCIVDHLTGAWNRYAMYSKLHQEKERQARTDHPCTICMMDIDYFKIVNDEHGHTVGDQVLRMVIDFCHSSLRKYDSIYRYGGEEFLFCLPDAELSETQTIIERLCISLGQHPIPLPSGEDLFVTASFGIAGLKKEISVEEAIQAADHALLCAKSKGRNRVCSWEDGLN